MDRLASEQVRSSVCFYFTTWQALELILLFDKELLDFFEHAGIISEDLLVRVHRWSVFQDLKAYCP